MYGDVRKNFVRRYGSRATNYRIVSLVYAGILLPAILTYQVITFNDNQRTKRSFMIPSGVALEVALAGAVTVAIVQPDLVCLLRCNSACEFSFLLLLPLIPNLFTSMVPAENAVYFCFLRRLIYIGTALTVFFAVFLFMFPVTTRYPTTRQK